ncbi:MAG: hypothetical protein U0163_01865 [Gemmatimonadaceae bacterium]
MSGLGATEFASVNFGGGGASATFINPNFTINSALPGARDLAATRTTVLGQVLNKLFLQRGLNPPNGGSVGTVDFNGANAFDPDTKTLTVNGLAGGEQVGGTVSFLTNTSSSMSLGTFQVPSGNSSNILVVPSAKTNAGDVHEINVNATLLSGGAGTIRSVNSFLRDPGNPTVTLGPDLSSSTVSTVATAPTRGCACNTPCSRSIQIAGSPRSSRPGVTQRRHRRAPGFLGNASSVDVTIPDFTGVGTWQASWGLQTGALTTWQASASGWIAGSGGTSDGTITRTAIRTGQTTP